MTEEGKLQRKIIKYAESRGVIVIKHMLCNKGGFPDLQLFFPYGSIIFMEAKSLTGKLSEKQKGMKRKLLDFCQTVHVIDSYDSSIFIINCVLRDDYKGMG